MGYYGELAETSPTTLLNSLILPTLGILSWNGRQNDDTVLLNKSVLKPTYNGCVSTALFFTLVFLVYVPRSPGKGNGYPL